MPSTLPNSDQAIKNALSAPRIGTYELATSGTPQLSSALALYAWNAQVAASMLAPLHFCEVAIRNAVADAIAAAHGAQWPWDAGFMRSLPDPPSGYNPRRDLMSARAGKATTGKVIPELKFMFWQTIFTSRRAFVGASPSSCFTARRHLKICRASPSADLHGFGSASEAAKPDCTPRADIHAKPNG